MNKEKLSEYFESFVVNYQPYREIPEYKIIIKSLIDYYFDHSYNHVNSPFKKAFEDQVIPIEFYNKLLLSIGFSEKILYVMSMKDKEILLSSFMDYNRFKGTINQFQKIGNRFGETFGIYELYIDYIPIETFNYTLQSFSENQFIINNYEFFSRIQVYDSIHINNIRYIILSKETIQTSEDNELLIVHVDTDYEGLEEEIQEFVFKKWVFIPDPIFKSEVVTLKENHFDYNVIYEGTKQYFISVNQLYDLYDNNNLVLPLKSNLLFLDYKKLSNVDTIHNLFAAIFLKEYYNSRLPVFFKDGTYSITLGRLYKLWYFVLIKFYNMDLINHSPVNIVAFDLFYYDFDYTIFDIPKINEIYKSITTTNEYSLFYKKYVVDKFKIENQNPINLTLDNYEHYLRQHIGTDVIDYVVNRIENFEIAKDIECESILIEIYDSLMTWSHLSENENIQQNIDFLLETMSFIIYSIDSSPSYNLILFLKPFHVELVKQFSSGIVINNIATSAIVGDGIRFNSKILKVTQEVISEPIVHKPKLVRYDNAIVTTGMAGLISNKHEINVNIQHEVEFNES